jgi:hypothetical protein
MEAIYFGNTHWMQNSGDNTTVGPDGKLLDGPYVGADLEAGMCELTYCLRPVAYLVSHTAAPDLLQTMEGGSLPSTTRETNR